MLLGIGLFVVSLLRANIARSQEFPERSSDDWGAESGSRSIGVLGMREQHNHHITLWAGIGGSGALAHTAPLAYAGGLSWQSYHLLLGGDILRNTSVQRTPPRYSWTEIDATVGYATAPRDLIAYGFLPEQLTLSASAGLSWYSFATNWRRGRGRVGAPVPVDTNASHVNTYEWGFGVPIQLQAHYTLLQYVGIGLVGFANINTKRSDAGVLLTAVISYY